ncbi:MAG TPA: RnfABCDGE type electron transport complex subunit D, partial [Myxococcota bacterium]|nr:RnfABCDGE type electron transport complex subunit D [Myxococcota bacterium]
MGLDRHTSDGIEDDERPAWTLAVALLPAWATHLFVVGDRVVPALAVLAAAPVLCVVFDVAITLPAGLRKRWAPRPRALLLGLLLPFWLPPLPPPWALTLGALLAVGFDRLRLPGIGPLPLQPLLLARV